MAIIGPPIDRENIVPGAYWVSGYELGRPSMRGLVEVRASLRRGLICNIHRCNTGGVDVLADWSPVSNLNPQIKFHGPLLATGATS